MTFESRAELPSPSLRSQILGGSSNVNNVKPDPLFSNVYCILRRRGTYLTAFGGRAISLTNQNNFRDSAPVWRFYEQLSSI